MQAKIPLLPFSPTLAEKLSRPLLFLGDRISKAFPALKADLYMAELPQTPAEYLSLTALAVIFYFAIIFSTLIGITTVVASPDFLISGGIAGLFSFFILGQMLIYPKILISKKNREINSNLLPALYHMMIEVRSGVPLFNVLVGVSEGYGKVSEEFKKVVSRINAGVPESEALDVASERNPSIYFRRAIMQIVNSMKSGGSISSALDSIVDNLTKEQIISVRKYAQELNPLTMIYMLLAVILPTLGMTFLIVLTSFSRTALPVIIFPLILFALGAFQFVFMGVVKSKRPATGV